MNSEDLNFKISITGTFHQKVPVYSILLNDQLIKHDVLTVNSGEIETIEFTSVVTDGANSLKIRLENKESSDTIVDNDVIIKDMVIDITDIKIDEIPIGSLLWNAEYLLDEPHDYHGQTVTRLENCVTLGWNGTYVLNFTSPFYIWLLENL